jgi:hypothetical protein
MFKRLIKNWKTSLAGVASLTTGITLIVNGHTEEGIAGIITGLGLLAAKDGNVTGGTNGQDGAVPMSLVGDRPDDREPKK